MPVMIWRASPSWMSDGSSPTIAPTTAAGAAIRNPVKRYGLDAGRRSLRRIADARRRVRPHQLQRARVVGAQAAQARRS